MSVRHTTHTTHTKLVDTRLIRLASEVVRAEGEIEPASIHCMAQNSYVDCEERKLVREKWFFFRPHSRLAGCISAELPSCEEIYLAMLLLSKESLIVWLRGFCYCCCCHCHCWANVVVVVVRRMMMEWSGKLYNFVHSCSYIFIQYLLIENDWYGEGLLTELWKRRFFSPSMDACVFFFIIIQEIWLNNGKWMVKADLCAWALAFVNGE